MSGKSDSDDVTLALLIHRVTALEGEMATIKRAGAWLATLVAGFLVTGLLAMLFRGGGQP